MLLWEWVWVIFGVWTPKPFNWWRLMLLRLFGASIRGVPFVHQRARIQIPWHVTLGDRSCLGDRANVYSLGEIHIEEGAVVAQEAYLCTGTHSFLEAGLPLKVAPIRIGKNAFIGARAFILPGVSVGEGAVVGACSVVTRDLEAYTVAVGNPGRVIRRLPQA